MNFPFSGFFETIMPNTHRTLMLTTTKATTTKKMSLKCYLFLSFFAKQNAHALIVCNREAKSSCCNIIIIVIIIKIYVVSVCKVKIYIGIDNIISCTYHIVHALSTFFAFLFSAVSLLFFVSGLSMSHVCLCPCDLV